MSVITPHGQEPKKLPAIIIGWDDELKQVHIMPPDPKAFPNFEFILSVLETAKEQIKFQQNVQRMQNLQIAQAEAARTNQMVNKIMQPPRRG